MSKSANRDLRQYRAIGHKLKPVVTVAEKGLSESVMAEVDAALARHELIKVKINVGDRDQRDSLARELCARAGAEQVQGIGNVILMLRRAEKPDPKLSNLVRPL